ncbi:hypothetical protein Mapa_015063 [Marchantia paleacea]|nr:hypothetical protein Mapa_015063 [Marchantia paleacea]
MAVTATRLRTDSSVTSLSLSLSRRQKKNSTEPPSLLPSPPPLPLTSDHSKRTGNPAPASPDSTRPSNFRGSWPSPLLHTPLRSSLLLPCTVSALPPRALSLVPSAPFLGS